MIQRIRTPAGDVRDVDYGPGSAISHRSRSASAMGAVSVAYAADATDTSKLSSNPLKGRMTRSQAAKAYWASLTPEQYAARLEQNKFR